MFRKEINERIMVVGEPTLRQNKAFMGLCMDSGLAFEISKDIDLSGYFRKMVCDDLLEKILMIMIHEDGKVWRSGSNDSLKEEIGSFTEGEIEEIFKEFFLKKKEWIFGLRGILENYVLQLLTSLGKRSKVLK